MSTAELEQVRNEIDEVTTSWWKLILCVPGFGFAVAVAALVLGSDPSRKYLALCLGMMAGFGAAWMYRWLGIIKEDSLTREVGHLRMRLLREGIAEVEQVMPERPYDVGRRGRPQRRHRPLLPEPTGGGSPSAPSSPASASVFDPTDAGWPWVDRSGSRGGRG